MSAWHAVPNVSGHYLASSTFASIFAGLADLTGCS